MTAMTDHEKETLRRVNSAWIVIYIMSAWLLWLTTVAYVPR